MPLRLVSRERGDKIEHRWRMTLHLDGCHWFASSYTCVYCGASLAVTDERSPNDDPWSSIWMIDEGGEPGCIRCEELLDGAEPQSTVVYEAAV